MEAAIVNPQPRYQRVPLIEPSPAGYIHIAALVEPAVGRTPIPRRTARKAALLAELKTLTGRLQRHDAVTKATVYRAALIPPPGKDWLRLAARPARYDVAVLIETTAPGSISDVEADPHYQQLLDSISSATRQHHLMRARCLRRVGEVDKNRQGLFLFNYFTARQPDVALDLWDHLAGWYAAETGLTNSTLLGPLSAADYVFINHARWDLPLPVFAARIFGKRSFYTYVLANLHANATAATPILYRLACR
ncbi:MAG: hypothetical protein ACRDPY_44055 [Streptosporangiaceae bacterium]